MTYLGKKSPLHVAILGLALSLVAGSVLAGNGDHKKRKKHHDKHEYRHQYQHDERYYNSRRRHHSGDYRFRDSDRQAIHRYYRDVQRSGKCPPGLAKKNKHCLPPGQYKKWQRGKPIAKNIRYYELPRGLRSHLSVPDDHYRYVRVDDDILLIDRVTHVVIDVIENILR
ncbi:MAG TPA: RcnB family protein [Thiopseudomonas sp.]|nr:RcnB family protein [Thiopseudomonas sp.]